MMKLAATGEKGVLMFSRRYARLAKEHMDRFSKPEIKTQVIIIIIIIIVIVTHFSTMYLTSNDEYVRV